MHPKIPNALVCYNLILLTVGLPRLLKLAMYICGAERRALGGYMTDLKAVLLVAICIWHILLGVPQRVCCLFQAR